MSNKNTSKTLYDSGEHMMTLLNEILDYSKIEQGHMEFDHTPFPLASLIGSINSVYHTLCDEKGLEFKVISKVPEGRWYLADKARLRQVLFNLLNNAVKFTHRGFIEVHIEEFEREDRNRVRIQVKDSGIGIALDAQQKIFQPFVQAESSTTRRFGGTGLGLSIVKQITEEFDGEVTVSSQLGLGTCFTLELNLMPCAAEKNTESVKHKLNYQGLRALVVEDNRTNTFIIETMLKNKGFICQSVTNGQEAVDIMAGQTFDVVFMDNHMPIMDGVESTRIIRSMAEPIDRTLVFACTADVFKETYENMLAAGCDAVIAKPIIEEELDDTLLRFASRLFQHRSAHKDQDFSTGNIAINKEFLLVELCMAVENGELQEARKVISAIARDDSLNAGDIAPVLHKIAQALDSQQRPRQEDMDLLTMLLAD